MKVKVTYQVSRQYRKQQLVEVGKDPGDRHQVELDLDTVELREAWVRLFGLSLDQAVTKTTGINSYVTYLRETPVNAEGKPYRRPYGGEITFDYNLPSYFDHIPDEAELKAHILKMAQAYMAGLGEVAAKAQAELDEYNRLQAAAEPLLAQIAALKEVGDEDGLRSLEIPEELADFKPRLNDKYRNPQTLAQIRGGAIRQIVDARDEARKAEASAQAEAEKAEWIKAHGSDRLKRAFEGGYEIGRIYTLERAAVEAPGFVVDYYDKAEWQDRPSPTVNELDAADEAAKLGLGPAQIVWLTAPPKDYPGNDEYYDESAYDFERGVALVIEAYQGKYNLVKQI